MPYDFDLTAEAEDDLIERWLEAANPMSVTQASNEVERLLRANPRLGEHQSEGLFRICEPPRVVYYEIDDVKRVVTVNNILAFRPR